MQYVLNIFATRIRENNILCEVRIEADLEIFGKKSILIQAIMNLVDNAVDAIVEREEEATEKNWIGVIEIEGRETADGIILSVWDNAGGIQRKGSEKNIRDVLFRQRGQGIRIGTSNSQKYHTKRFSRGSDGSEQRRGRRIPDYSAEIWRVSYG